MYVFASPTRMKVVHVDLSVGNAARKLALDGFPTKQIIASDLSPGKIKFLHSLSSF